MPDTAAPVAATRAAEAGVGFITGTAAAAAPFAGLTAAAGSARPEPPVWRAGFTAGAHTVAEGRGRSSTGSTGAGAVGAAAGPGLETGPADGALTAGSGESPRRRAAGAFGEPVRPPRSDGPDASSSEPGAALSG
ncbi:MAG: hypothetical protein ACKOQ4_00130 [Mycobacterium sp.]